MPPLVVAEVVTGAHTAANQEAIFELLQDTPTHPTDLLHWLEVGRLRRHLAAKGINVTIPDAHIAQCALELNAVLLTRDAVFTKIATQVPLRLRE